MIKRRLRRAGRWVGVVVGVACAVYVVVSLALPWVAGWVLHRELAARGMAGVEFRVRRVSPWGLVLSDVGSGKAGTVRAGAVSVSYSPATLWRGEVGAVRVSGADVLLSVNEGKVDLGTLGAVARTGSSGGGGVTASLPGRVEIVSSTVKVDWAGTDLLLPLDGEMQRQSDGTYALSAATYVAGSPVKLSGTISGDRAVALKAEGKLALAAVLAALPGKWRDAAPHCGGAVTVTAGYDWDGKTGKGSVSVASAGPVWAETTAGGQGVRVKDANLLANFAWGSGGIKASASVRKADVSVADLEAKLAADVSLSGDDGRVSVSGGGNGLEVEALNATVKNAWSRPEISVDLDVRGTLPTEILRAARANNVVLDRLGAVAVRGTVAAGEDEHGAWGARWEGVKVAVGPGDVILPRRAVLTGIGGEFVTRGSAGAAGIKAVLAQGSKLSVKEARGALLGTATASAAVAVTDEVAANWMGGKWDVEVTGAKVEAGSAGMDLGGVHVEKPAAAVLISAALAADGGVVKVIEGSTLSAAGLKGTHGAWSGNAVKLALTPGEAFSYSGRTTWVSGGVANAGDVVVTAGGTSGTVKSLRASARYDVGGGVLDASIEIADGSVTAKDAGVTVDGIAVSMPFVMRDGPVPLGRLTCKRVVIGNKTLPGVEGTVALDLDRKAATAAASWAALSEGELEASANFAWGGEVPTADVRLTVPAFDLTEAQEVRKFLPQPGSLEVTGRFGADSRFAYDGVKWTNWGKVHVSDAALRNKDWAADLSGISGDVSFNSFAPFTTPGGQTVKVAKGTLGKLAVSDGSVGFRVEGGGIIFIEMAQFGWAGGTLTARGFRVDPAKAAADLVVRADAVAMKDVLSLASGTAVGGEGKLFGKIPVNVRWPQFKLGEGYLYSTPGPGVLQLSGAGDEVSEMLDKTAAFKDPTMAQVKPRIVEALKDFEYQIFRIDLRQQPNGELVTALSIQGQGREKGPNGQPGQGVNLNVNVTGLDSLLSTALAAKRTLEGGGK